MTHTPTIRNAVVLAIFFVIQFFWFTAAFTYSESRTVRSEIERSERMSVPATPEAIAEALQGEMKQFDRARVIREKHSLSRLIERIVSTLS